MPYVILPNSGQSLGETRDQIRTNFSLIQSAFDANHESLSNNDGKHKFLQMPVRSSLSIPNTAALEGGLYTKNVGSGVTQLFYRRESNGSEYQLTSALAPIAAQQGRTFLPGGLIMIFDLVTVSSATQAVTFHNGGFPNNCYNVSLTGLTSGGTQEKTLSISDGTVALTGFTWRITGSSISTFSKVFYCAIGN